MLRGTPDGIAAPARPSGPRLHDDPVRPAFLTAKVSTPTRGPGQYLVDLEAEARSALDYFLERSASLPNEVRLHLLLVPLKDKAALEAHLHKRLRNLQQPEVEENDDEGAGS